MPAAKFVGRVWGTVEGGAKLDVHVTADGREDWVPFSQHDSNELIQFRSPAAWEIAVSNVSEIEPIVRAICSTRALARDDDFLRDPDAIGFRARYLTIVGPTGEPAELRLVTEAMRDARQYAMEVYQYYANMPSMGALELASLNQELRLVRSRFESAEQRTASPPAEMSVDALISVASRLAELWGWERPQSGHGGDVELPVGERVAEGPPRPWPVGIAELLFFGRPIAQAEQTSIANNRQLLLPLSPMRSREPRDPEWERLFDELAGGSVSAVMEHVPVRSLAYHNPRYRPADRRTESSVARNLKLITSGERPWLRVRRLGRRPASPWYVVSQDYPLLKAYRDSKLPFAVCLVLAEDQPAA